MADAVLADPIRAFGAAHHYRSVTIERWLGLAAADGAALLQLAQELRLGENQLRALWNWAEEVAERDGLSLAQVLALDAVLAARRRPGSRNDTLKSTKGALRRLRFPELAAVEDRLAALVRGLGLPPAIQITLPDFLEGDSVRVEIVASSASQLRAAAASLQAAAATTTCDDIFALLAEAP